MNVSIESLVASAIQEGSKQHVKKSNDIDNEAIKVAQELEKLAELHESEAAALHQAETEKTAKLRQAEELIDAIIAVCEEGE